MTREDSKVHQRQHQSVFFLFNSMFLSMSSLDFWCLGLRLWVSKIDIFYKHRPSFPSQSSILAYGSKTLYSRSSQLPLPCSALSCHFNHHWRRCCWIEKQNQNMRIGFHAVLCPVSCVLSSVSCVLCPQH